MIVDSGLSILVTIRLYFLLKSFLTGSDSAFPSSLHSVTFWSICVLISGLISDVKKTEHPKLVTPNTYSHYQFSLLAAVVVVVVVVFLTSVASISSTIFNVGGCYA